MSENLEIEKFAKEMALIAGDYALEKGGEFEVSSKGGDYRDLVTNVDLEITELLRKEIAKEFPEHGFYSEEDKTTLSKEGYVWVIDPIDGTSNYARQLPFYASCVTVMKDGEVITSSIYCPTLKDLFHLNNEGVFLNSESVEVNTIKELREAYVVFHPGRKPENITWAGEMKMKLLKSAKKSINFASSALDLCYLAAGKLDVVVYGTLTTIDIAGTIEMVRKAGGEVYNYDTREPIEFLEEPQKIIAVANESLRDDYFRKMT